MINASVDVTVQVMVREGKRLRKSWMTPRLTASLLRLWRRSNLGEIEIRVGQYYSKMPLKKELIQLAKDTLDLFLKETPELKEAV